MSDASIKQFSIVGTISDILGRGTDLVEKEIRLAKAEITENITARLMAGIWIGASLLSGFLTVLLLIEGIVLILINRGMPAPAACFLMAAVIAVLAIGLFLKGRAMNAARLSPDKSVRNIRRDIAMARQSRSN